MLKLKANKLVLAITISMLFAITSINVFEFMNNIQRSLYLHFLI